MARLYMGVTKKDGKEYLLGVWDDLDAARDYIKNHQFSGTTNTRVTLLDVPDNTHPADVVAFAKEYARKKGLQRTFLNKRRKLSHECLTLIDIFGV